MTVWSWLLIAAGTTVVLYATFVVALVVAGRRADARALAGFLPDCLVLFRRLVADERVLRHSKRAEMVSLTQRGWQLAFTGEPKEAPQNVVIRS